MAVHSSILAWKIQRTEKPNGLQSMGSIEKNNKKIIFEVLRYVLRE